MQPSEIELQNRRIGDWVDEFGKARGALLPILQEIQAHYGYVSPHSMQVVAGLLGIHPVEVYGVVSFYSFLSEKPGGKCRLRLCKTLTCELAGKAAVAGKLTEALGIGFGETTQDGTFTLEWAACIGQCDRGPALLANDKVYAPVTPEQIPGIVAELRAGLCETASRKTDRGGKAEVEK